MAPEQSMERNEEEFAKVVEQYKAVIYKVCSMYADGRDEMADYCQEVLMNMWRGWGSFRGECALSTWVYRVALYTCVSFVRRKCSRPRSMALTIDMPVADDGDRAPMLRELYRLIGRLNRLDRALILLWLDERHYAEIAEIMGISKANVAVKIMRIKERLKRMSEE